MSTQTFNISLPRGLVAKADKVAKREYKNRSELIREAIRLYISVSSDDFLKLSQKQAAYIIGLDEGENDANNYDPKKVKPFKI